MQMAGVRLPSLRVCPSFRSLRGLERDGVYGTRVVLGWDELALSVQRDDGPGLSWTYSISLPKEDEDGEDGEDDQH
jgi:hypothetical protein